LVSAKFRGNSANDSAKSSLSHAKSKFNSADLNTDLTGNYSADSEEDKSMNMLTSAKSSKSAKSSSVAQGTSNSAKSNANDSAESEEETSETWEELNRSLEIKYGLTKHIKIKPTDKDKERIFLFIENSKDKDDRFLANIWLQKFYHWEEKTSEKIQKPREKSTRMKPSSQDRSSSQIQASAKSVSRVKLSLPMEELPSMDHVPAKVLSKEMIGQWKVRFHELIDKMYSFDSTKGEQNR
jgi:hypothetical protein